MQYDPEDGNQSIELHPTTQRLLDEVALLREELAERLAELHDLEHTVKPNLLAIFQTKLGPWELRLLKARCEAARWKRKIEMIQAATNRGQPPDMDKIEDALEIEFRTWQQQMQEAGQNIEHAQFRLGHLLEPGEDKELKQLFYKLAKKLHPDINPELDAEKEVLWLQVLAAYETGDLQKLKALALVVEADTPGVADPQTDIEKLQTEHERLRVNLKRLYDQIAAIQAQPPFSMQAQWTDDAWVTQRRVELEAQEIAVREQAAALEKHLQALLIVYGSGKQSGLN